VKTTFKQEVVYQLLHWLEGNIHTPLTINDFVEKSGYSKWHLQRIFKEVTGQKLASYCRQRRLTSSAFMLRLFDKQIDSVGSEHGFSSHNVYHKTFKRHFNVTPAQYRDALHWSCKGLCPPINLTTLAVPEGQMVELEALTLQGRVTDHAFTLDTLCDFCWDQRETLWQQQLATTTVMPGELYALTKVIKGGPRAEDCATLQYLACLNPEAAGGEPQPVQVTVDRQMYLHFIFEGDVQQYADFIRLVYEHALPTAGAVRRDGYDIERIDPQCFSASRSGRIDYYVPVVA
jgi:AraC family transcriptional activator of mar-sox-rob regulon